MLKNHIGMHLTNLFRLVARWLKRTSNIMAITTVVTVVILAGHTASAQITPRPPNPLASLKDVTVPEPENLGEFVKNKAAAIALGKALFWDMQVGSDGIISCASCHHHAGVDPRPKNQVSPGLLRVNASGEPDPDITFNAGGPNSVLQPGDFPFHKLADPNNASSQVLAHTNDVVGSQGVTLAKFIDTVPGNSADEVEVVPDPVFNVQGINVRQVTERNTPTMINAVFNFRQFWDGRAQNEFNGVNPFGSRDPNAFVLKAPTSDTPLQQVKISLKNASLASQAVGPPLSSVEESATGRTFPEIGQKFHGIINLNLLGLAVPLPRDLGKKLRVLRPLGKQLVHRQDSVLGSLSLWPLRGLIKGSYENMIQEAFQRVWWDSPYIIKVDANGGTRSFRRWLGPLASDEYSLMDYNFSLFFGLAIQMYESTLKSDDAPFDRFMDGNSNALTVQQQQGKAVFEQSCVFCHGGAETTNASVKNLERLRLRRMAVGSGQAVYDNAFYNIGVLPTAEDLGVGGKDPFGNPLSESRLAAQGRFEQLLSERPNIDVSPDERITADGAFKTPGLRNIELTAPYFHNGGQLTLRQVVEFYNRGGDFAQNNSDNVDIGIRPLGLSEDQKTSLVAFMQSLTDERVAKERAPFDHPQLFITNGHPGDQNAVTDDGSGQATTKLVELPAVGRYGITTPRPNFLGVTSEQSPTTITPASSPNPLEGSMTQEDCPLGSILKSVIGGYMCVTK
jgi:cytochrome c peroxidase